jgi:hypothetical protein
VGGIRIAQNESADSRQLFLLCAYRTWPSDGLQSELTVAGILMRLLVEFCEPNFCLSNRIV